MIGQSAVRALAAASRQVRGMATYVKTEPLAEYVLGIELSRADKRNAFNDQMLRELEASFVAAGENPDCRVIVLSGAGKCFTGGVDLKYLMSLSSVVADEDLDTARKATKLRPFITKFQRSIVAPVKCPRPVIAAIHGPCVGAGVDLVSGADIRLCSADAWFQVKEVDVGLAADVGTLARLTKIVGSESWSREIAFTARVVQAQEALNRGLVSSVFPDREAVMKAALEMAKTIASKSPVAVQGTKVNMEYALNHSTDESLDYIATWNMSMLMSEDLIKAAVTQLDPDSEKPVFAKL